MIDLLAMLAMPTAAPTVPLAGLVEAAEPVATDAPMTEADLSDFASVLAALVTPTPLAAPFTPAAPSSPVTPLLCPSPVAPQHQTTTDVVQSASAPVATAADAPVGRIIAFIPVPPQFAKAAPLDALTAPVIPLPTSGDASSNVEVPVAQPVAQEVATPVDGKPVVQQDHVVHNTEVPEREGAPAPVDVPEPAPKALVHPATLGVLGRDWGDTDAQSRAEAPVDNPVFTPAPDRSLQLVRTPNPEMLQRMAAVVPATPAAPPTPATPDTPADAAAPVAPVASEPVLPVAHAIPDAVDIPATRATGDAAPDAVVAATAAPVHQAAVHASTTVTHSDDDPRPVRSVAAPLRHAVREAAERKDGEHTITIRLDPPELGTVRIRVEAHGEKVSVTLHTELAEAKTELQTKHRDIADILRNEGFTLDGFDVDTSDQRPQRDDKQQQHRSAPTPTDVFELQDQLDDGELRL